MTNDAFSRCTSRIHLARTLLRAYFPTKRSKNADRRGRALDIAHLREASLLSLISLTKPSLRPAGSDCVRSATFRASFNRANQQCKNAFAGE